MTWGSLVYGQISVERSVQLFAEYNDQTGFMDLHWLPVNGATAYNVGIRNNTTWNQLQQLTDQDTMWTFSGLEKGQGYEFRVQKTGNPVGYGYIYTGVELPPVIDRGSCLVVIEKSLADPLSQEIQQYLNDIEADGWTTDTIHVIMDQTSEEVRTRIQEWYADKEGEKNSVFLLGHVPVPYSGIIAPDGHGDHNGAWPADVYYAEMNGRWTDQTANNITARDARNHNVPGDGKWDNSSISTDVELEVGRVDMFDLPAFANDYIELTRQYLNKNHDFRTKAFEVQRRGLIENNFASFQEGFGQNGWKNFAPMFGPENVVRGNYEVDLENEDYLFAYACGAGSYTSMGGVGNVNNLYVQRDIKGVFVMNFGSYFGDWDRQNNLLRAALASGTILTNAWAARPNWQFHHMALGETVGYAAKLSQNNLFTYESGFGARSIHVALLGDPTLRLHPMSPPGDLSFQDQRGGTVVVSWTPSEDAEEGYLVLRKEAGDEGFELLTSEAIFDTLFIDSCLQANVDYVYQVKAMKLETSASGSYYNTSVGKTAIFNTAYPGLPDIQFNALQNYEEVTFQNATMFLGNVLWEFGDGNTSTENDPVHLYDRGGTYEVCLSSMTPCGEARKCDTLVVESSLPDLVDFEIKDASCHDWDDGEITALISGGLSPLTYLWSNGDQDSIAQDLGAGFYNLVISSTIGVQERYGPVEVEAPDSLDIEVWTTPSSGNDGEAATAITGGTPPYDLTWGDGTLDPSRLPPGDHTLTVVDRNGCTKSITFNVPMATSVNNLLAKDFRMHPNPSAGRVTMEWNGPAEIVQVEVISATGQTVMTRDWTSGRMTLDDLPAGQQLIKVITDQGYFVKKVVVVGQ
jgi:PKD repeat protein